MQHANWIAQARQHLQEHQPTLYRALRERGTLEAHLQTAVERTSEEIAELVAEGFDREQAWEMTREKYLLLPPESEPDEVESKGAALFNEANALQSQILQTQNEETSQS